MSALYRIETLKTEQTKVFLRISIMHPDEIWSLSDYQKFLMEYLVYYFHFLKVAYTIDMGNIPLSKEEMEEKAINLQAKDDFLYWEKFLYGEEIPITKEEYEDTSSSNFGHNPSKEQYESVKKAYNRLENKLRVSIYGFSSHINEELGIEKYYAISSPKSLKSIAKKVILNIEHGKSKIFKRYSKAKQCYAFEELSFEVSDIRYIEHLYAGSYIEI
jgi:hypothetical protein